MSCSVLFYSPALQLFQVPGYSIPTCVRCSEQLTNNSNFHQSAAAAAAVAASASAAVAASAAAAATSSSTASSSDSDAIAQQQQHQNPQQQQHQNSQQQQQQQQQMQSSSSSENLQSQDDSEDVSPFQGLGYQGRESVAKGIVSGLHYVQCCERHGQKVAANTVLQRAY